MCQLPFFIVRYDMDTWRFSVKPLNDHAEHVTPPWAKAGRLDVKLTTVDEMEYVQFLYGLRGRSVPVDVLRDLESNRAGSRSATERI